MSRLTRIIAFLLVLAALPSRAHAQTTTFTDATFLDADWTVTTQILNLGGTSSGTQVATGGSTGSYRQIVNTLNSAIGQSFSNTVFAFHARAGATFSPSLSGGITGIDYSESSIRITGGVQACGVALLQGGTIYYGPSFLNPSTFGVWAPTTQTSLLATNFDALAPGVQNPDFSVTAAPIQWGFFRANSTSVGGGGSSTTGGIDNWSVTVHYDAATPARSTSWGRLKSLYHPAR